MPRTPSRGLTEREGESLAILWDLGVAVGGAALVLTSWLALPAGAQRADLPGVAIERTEPLPEVVSLAALQREADALMAAFAAGDAQARQRAMALAGARRPVRAAIELAPEHARLVVAHEQGAASWDEATRWFALEPPVRDALQAITTGDAGRLTRLVVTHPELARATSHKGWALLGHVGVSGSENEWERFPERIEMARILLKAGAMVDADRGRALMAAVTWNDTLLAAALIDAGAAMDGVADDGWILATALLSGQGDAAAFLVNRGARVDAAMAAGVGRLDLLGGFFDDAGRLRADTELLAGWWYGDPPAHVDRHEPQRVLDHAFGTACLAGQLQAAAYLLERGADIDAKVHRDGRLPTLHMAARAGDDRLVEFLLRRGADRSLADDEHRMPAYEHARARGHRRLTTLLERGPAPQREFDMALGALLNGSVERFGQLLSAHPELATQPAWTANGLGYLLERAAAPEASDPTHGRYADCLRLLLAAGATPDMTLHTNGHGQALRRAAGAGHIAAVRLLVVAGAAIDGSGDRRSPLAEALYWQQAEAAQMLLRMGARADALHLAAGTGRLAQVRRHFDTDGSLAPSARGSAANGGDGVAPPSDRRAILSEAFLYAVHGGQFAAADLLLERGADIDYAEPLADMPDRVGMLHFAARQGDGVAVRYLLERGIDATRVDGHGLGADGWAELHGHPEVAARIRAHLAAAGPVGPPLDALRQSP